MKKKWFKGWVRGAIIGGLIWLSGFGVLLYMSRSNIGGQDLELFFKYVWAPLRSGADVSGITLLSNGILWTVAGALIGKYYSKRK